MIDGKIGGEEILALINQVVMLLTMLFVGFTFKKLKFGEEKFAKGLANLTLYVAQPALIINSFVMDYKADIIKNIIQVAIFSVVAHAIFFGIAMMFFKKVPVEKQKVLRFAVLFSNAGYMGILLIAAFMGADAAIYAAVYNIGFNFFIWSIGCYMYSGDKKYMSVKKMFINPATVSIYIGLIVFLTPLNKLFGPTGNLTVLGSCFKYIGDMVVPLSMILVGFHMASVNWKGAFKDLEMYKCLLLRLFACPIIIWGLLKILMIFGLCTPITMSIVLICSATPCATSVGVFAEKFNCDTVTSGKLVPISTILALGTMPLVALLLLIPDFSIF